MIVASEFLKWLEIFGVRTGGMGGTVTSITAGTGLTGGTITTSGTIALALPVTVVHGGTGLTSTTANALLYSSATSVIGQITPVASAVLSTDAGGVPSLSTTLPAGLTVPGYLPLAGGTMSGAISMGAHQINNLLAPTADTDASTKLYVDTVASGLAPAGAVDAATTATFDATYNNGAAGVGATLTANSVGAVSLDGVAVTLTGDYLFKNQADNTQNGIYTCTTLGDGSTAAIFTRDNRYDTPEKINETGIVPVIGGSTQAGQGYYETSTIVTIGVTPIIYVNFGNSGTVTSITAGTGLTGGTITGTGTIALSIPVVVSSGGTGIITTTAYGLLAGGTTATGAFQNVGTGASGTMLQGAGSSALPAYSTTTWPATLPINEVLFASSANTITGVTAANSSVFVSGVSGIPAWSTTLPSGLTIPGYAKSGANSDITSLTGLTGTIQAPTGITSSAGLNLVTFTYVASAVNYVNIINSITGNYPQIRGTGSDASVGLGFQSKGGVFQFSDYTGSATASIAVFDQTGAKGVGFKSPASLAANILWTLPGTDSAGFLQSNGSAVLSFGFQSVAQLTDVAWTDMSGTIGITGFTGSPTVTARYKVIGKTIFFNIQVNGTSNANTFTITSMPKTASVDSYGDLIQATDNSTTSYQAAWTIAASGTTITVKIGNNPAGWTASGIKNAFFSGFYETT